MCGWHSPEKKELSDWLLEKKMRVIASPEWRIDGVVGARHASPVLEALRENRQLFLEMTNREGDLSAAEQFNWFEVEHADELFVPYRSPGGMLGRLLKEYRKQSLLEPSLKPR